MSLVSDCHGVFTRFYNLPEKNLNETIGIVVLGDFSINFYLNKTDNKKKKELCQNYPNFIFYLVRGNHEARPQDLPNIQKIYDENVKGIVYWEPEYPNIRYFLDYGFYKINNYLCLVIGGAYSVDKAWRLTRVGLTEETNIPKKSGWFNNEQLDEQERYDCLDTLNYWTSIGELDKIDFVLTHTCPKSFQPVDKFLSFIDQSTVDTTMEDFLEEVKKKITYDIWLFGHYHDDRVELPHVEQYYNDIETFDNIKERWRKYDETGELDWWINKSPKFREVIDGNN